MKGFWNKRRLIYTVLFILSLGIILFTGWDSSSEDSSRSLTFTKDGITAFRRGLDLSGGTRLVYRIAYDKYEETYTNPQELQSVKKTVEEIILKNIDGRISKLGVSDYKAYVQNLDDETQIVVEIGGIADLDQAKEIIGKTVELEFRLPNNEEPTQESILLREVMAKNLQKDIAKNTEKMKEITNGRASDNIFYNEFTGASLSQLPEFYQTNKELLDSIPLGEISAVTSGIYGKAQYQNGSGEMVTDPLNGFTFFKVNKRENASRSGAQANDIAQIADELGLTYTLTQEKETTIGQNTYDIKEGTLAFNMGQVLTGATGYDVKVIAFSKEDTANKTPADAEAINTQLQTQLDTALTTFKDNPDQIPNSGTLIQEGYLALTDLNTALPGYDPNKGEFQTLIEPDGGYIIQIKGVKAPNETLYNLVKVEGVNADEFEQKLKSQVIYDIEDVFVQDRETWTPAKSANGEILNGAFFEYAGTSSSQLNQPVVTIHFNEGGKSLFCNITKAYRGKQMAIFVGGSIVTAPTIQAEICDGVAQIDGQFTPESAKELASSLNDGALPAPLILMQEEKISPTLGQDALLGAIIATVAGVLLIIVYMWIMYGFKKAMISLITLVEFFTIILAIIKLTDYALSLSGIAAIILSIAMAVDVCILIFERMREEVRDGKPESASIDASYERSWPAVRDAQISTGLIGLLLFAVGINIFKGFGTMLCISVILTLCVNAPMTKELLHIFYDGKSPKKTTSK